jgi:2-polyprenyl-6-methoxyphenol hydroxylase-like FAD-dependent oxidoreductase
MPLSPTTRVLIIGGGIGGLALAQGLKKNGVPFTVFERDSTPNARSQGYRIKIFADAAADLKNILPDKLWKNFEETCAETAMGESTLNVLDASMVASRINRGPRPYTVDRGVLRSVLMEDLGGDIVWGKNFVQYELKGSEAIAHFSDGSTETGTLLVAADGTRSPVRKQYLPAASLVDTEGCCIFGKTPITPEVEIQVTHKAMKWITLCRDTAPLLQDIILGGVPITLIVEAMRFKNKDVREDVPQDYIYWAILTPKKLLGPTDEILSKVLEQPPRDLSLMIGSQWDPSIRAILENQDTAQSSAIRIVSALPDLPTWDTDPRITLIGDAIHAMSPAGGVGAVTALKDAATLTKALTTEGITAVSIDAYESAMRAYAGACIRRSFAGGNRLYGQPPFDQCKVVDV